MALPQVFSNAPSAGYITWSAFGIQYNGVSYSIAAGNTNKKFVWWKYSFGIGTVNTGDVLPNDLTPDDLVLFLNKSGVGVLAATAQIVDGSLIVSGSVLADAIGANQIETWHLDGQIITANNLAANAVTANSIAAGAITTNKLSVATINDDSVANGSFEDGVQGWQKVAGTGGTADVVTGVSSSGAYALRVIRGTTNIEVMQDSNFFIPVTAVAGRSWYVAARAGAGVALASGFYLRVMWYQADKVTAASTASVDIVSNAALATAWGLFEGQVTPPSNARYMAIKIINANGTSTMYVDEVSAYEVIQSAAIADGAITAAKILANSITSNEIKAGTILAADIAANTITAAQIAAGTITANEIATGAVTAGKISGTAIDGMTITGATVQTTATASRGIKINSTGFSAYNSSGTRTVFIDPTTGALTATSGSFTGAVNATSGTFSGDIALSGSITSSTVGSYATITNGAFKTGFLGSNPSSVLMNSNQISFINDDETSTDASWDRVGIRWNQINAAPMVSLTNSGGNIQLLGNISTTGGTLLTGISVGRNTQTGAAGGYVAADVPNGLRATQLFVDSIFNTSGTPMDVYARFTTKASMSSGTLVGQHATVYADSTTANNGDYVWDGSAWVPTFLTIGGKVIRSTASATLGATWNVLNNSTFWTVDRAAQGMNAFNGSWVAPIDGVYSIGAGLQLDTTAQCILGVKKNNTAANNAGFIAATSVTGFAAYTALNLSATVGLNAGDSLVLAAFCNVVSTWNTGNPGNSFFSIKWQSAL